MGLAPAVVFPRMTRMLDNLRIHQTFLVLLAALAAGWIRSSVTEGVRTGRVTTQAIWRR
jgi:hypothetical protein